MLKNAIRSGIIITVFFVALIQTTSVRGDELYFIDAHSQVDHKVAPLENVISIMKQGGVSHTILSARGKQKSKALLSFASHYREQITPAIRTKGRSYETGSAKYYKNLERQFASGRFSAIAEILLYHAQKGDKAPEYVIYPEDDRVRTALEFAVGKQWPFVVHVEFGSLHGKMRKHFMGQLERMLDQYPAHPVVLTHLGQLNPAECRRLIEAHKNLHFHTAWTNPAALRSSNQPWMDIFKGNRIAPEWCDLFIQYPERFVFALDNVFVEHWTAVFYAKQMTYWKKALAELPIQVAHFMAHGNAERLWHIASKR